MANLLCRLYLSAFEQCPFTHSFRPVKHTTVSGPTTELDDTVNDLDSRELYGPENIKVSIVGHQQLCILDI